MKPRKTDFCVVPKKHRKMNFTQEQMSEIFDEIASKMM